MPMTAQMTAQIEKTRAGGVVLRTPYDEQFVSELKEKIPPQERNWDAYHKVWGVSANYADIAEEIFRSHFGSDDELLSAEIEQIKENQEYIINREAHINEAISALDAAVLRYSFNSKSHIKGRMARNRALLKHSLDNAKAQVESLTELQVRGLAAAVRLLETRSIKQMTAR
jgi:hypothetical protein